MSKPVQGLSRPRASGETSHDPADEHSSTPQPSRDWDRFAAEFVEGHFEANPHAAIDAGRHEYDGHLPDWSLEALTAEAERLSRARTTALGFTDEQLDDARRFERDYLISVVDRDLFWRERARWHETSPGFYTYALNPTVYITREYAPLEERLAAFIAYAGRVPAAVEQMMGNLGTPMARTYAALGATAIGGLAEYLETDAVTTFRGVGGPDAQAEFERTRNEAVAAFRGAQAWFDEQVESGTDSFALGRETFEEMLRATEQVDVPVEELVELAEADLQRNLDALAEAGERLAPGRPVKECVALVQSHKPPEGPVAAARRQLGRLKAFVAERELVTIPEGEEVVVRETPPFHRWNAGMIDIPGPFEEGMPAIYYITPPDPTWTTEEQTRYIPGEADLLFMSLHEVWPGHFLHFQCAGKQPSKFGRIFNGYAFTEGWAHYAEEMMCEAGFCADDPETQIGQLLNALIRNVRFVVALGLHTSGMSVEEAEDIFREKAFMDPMNAVQQAARGTFDPAYLSYTLGKLMIRKLRADWMAERGGAASLREFHDSLVALGAPPVPLARRRLLESDDGSLI